MRSKRSSALAGVLVAVFVVCVCHAGFRHSQPRHLSCAATADPSQGKNGVSDLKVTKDTHGFWFVEFDYYYTGAPQFAALRVDLDPPTVSSKGPGGKHFQDINDLQPPMPGAHHERVMLNHPGTDQLTRSISVKLLKSIEDDDVIASDTIETNLSWPTFSTWIRNQQLARFSSAENLAHAVQLIDTGDERQLGDAEGVLEYLVRENPKLDAAYVEMARVAMKLNWGPAGWHQAETLLSSALEINPQGTNAKVLLGYVYTQQRQFMKAQSLFTQAATANPPNAWLWENWGEMLEKQGKLDEAVQKYRETLARPMTHDTYDRGRAAAYQKLLTILQQRNDFDAMEVLYRQRIAEFGPGSCFSSGYARFKLQVRGDADGAIELARGALNQDCEDSEARELLGMAEYVKWAESKGGERNEALNNARIYLPAGPLALYLLASNDRTVAAAKALLTSGEQIDEKDNDELSALAYALRDGNVDAARRLMKLGARSDLPVGSTGMPVALIPVVAERVEVVRMMQKYGVDYSKLRFRGATALDFAKQSGNSALLDALTGKESVL